MFLPSYLWKSRGYIPLLATIVFTLSLHHVRCAPQTFADIDVAVDLNKKGTIARDRGDLAIAIECYLQALAIYKNVAPGSRDVATVLNNLGVVFRSRGDLVQAEAYYRQALAIYETLKPDSLDVALILSNLGVVFRNRGDLPKAEEYHKRALAIREKQAPDSADVASSLNNLGVVLRDRGQLTKAEEYYVQALAIYLRVAPSSLDVATVLNNMGSVDWGRAYYDNAMRYQRHALAIQEKLAPSSLGQAESLHAMGSMLFDQGQTAQAILCYELAINTFERQMRLLGGDDEVRSTFGAQYLIYYRDYIEALLVQKQYERAFFALERSRARSLLTMIAEREMVLDSDLPFDVQRERKLNAAACVRAQAKIARLIPTKDATEIDQELAHLHELAVERDQIAERIKRASPRLAALQYPQPLDLRATRRALDTDTILLSYWVTPTATTLFGLVRGICG